MTALDPGRRGSAGLGALWSPASVAVVGASDDPSKWGHWLASGALSGAAVRPVYLVNRKGGTVCGTAAVRSLRELRDPVDLVAIAVPAPAVEGAVDDALDAGARTLLVITEGLGRDLHDGLARRATAAGARLVGPSSLGVADTSESLHLAWGRFTPGPVAVVTQSGQVGSELANLLAGHGSGVSRFASVGAQADITTEELLADLAGDPGTRAVVTYLEGVRDPQAFLAAVGGLRAAGKPLVVLASGASEAGSAAARSHTGALTAGSDVLDAACRAAGAVRARTPARAAALAHALALGVRPRGRRVVVLSDSGGQGALAADLAEDAGLAVAPLPAGPSARVRALLPRATAGQNPIDLAGAGEQDLASYAAVAEAAAEGADAVVLSGYFGRFGVETPSLDAAERDVASRLAALAARVPVVVHTMAPDGPAARTLTAGGVPAFGDIATALAAVAGCAAWTAAAPRALPPRPPEPAAPETRLPYLDGLAVLRRAGVPVPDAVPVTSADETAAGARWPGPSALKAADLAHKTEAGGLRLGLRTPDQVRQAYRELADRLGETTLVLEPMDDRPDVVELLVGVRHDPVFGPVVLVGAGGVTTEVWRDTAVELAPVDPARARAMLARLRCHPLLLGWRGAPAADLDGLARCVAAVSRIPFTDPAVRACEINPLRVGPDGPVAVDALVYTTGADHD